MSELATIVSHGWTAFSLAATLAGIGGIGLIALAVLATAYLPAWLRRPLIGAGIVLLVGAALYQAGQAKGAHDAFAVEAARTLRQEKARAEAALREERRQVAEANKISADDRARADAATAAAKASAKRLADLQRHLARTPDGACVGGDDARMLRGL
ncbi:hypothetical protein ACQKQD_16145 [Methylobacterium sp. NPDC080182]|uniref:hypothetical protein n=1 Tax=Methylobacterium sp. NPDC080182 TaxID=3390590 RepID=UPI003D012B3F